LTRIASSEYEMWGYVLSQNADELVQMLDRMMVRLQTIRDHVSAGADEKLRSLFEEAATIRENVPSRNKGFVQPLSDVFVFVRDQPGAIHTVTGALTEAGINIKDIELLKIREGTGGTFRIGLDSDQDAASAEKILTSTGFETRRLSIED